MKFENPYNPSAAEIESWAYDKNLSEPEQDFDLFVATKFEQDLFLNLATDYKCPKKLYFLHILYLIIGDAVKTDYKSYERYNIEGFLKKAENNKNSDIKLWYKRSKELIKDPSLFEYDNWCTGVYAKFNWKII